MRNLASAIWQLPRRVSMAGITAYQCTLSPDHGPWRHVHDFGYCCHAETCSQYAKRMLQEKGFTLGWLLSVKRVLSCHPWRKLDEEKVQQVLQLSFVSKNETK